MFPLCLVQSVLIHFFSGNGSFTRVVLKVLKVIDREVKVSAVRVVDGGNFHLRAITSLTCFSVRGLFFFFFFFPSSHSGFITSRLMILRVETEVDSSVEVFVHGFVLELEVSVVCIEVFLSKGLGFIGHFSAIYDLLIAIIVTFTFTFIIMMMEEGFITFFGIRLYVVLSCFPVSVVVRFLHIQPGLFREGGGSCVNVGGCGCEGAEVQQLGLE
mmetsp:Transcript_24576/g.41198  ORF Transcript_24576/g.41198 Transcript_24576/m.41198 type:complete len:214 (+) Transcript_24576:532-1173(+)